MKVAIGTADGETNGLGRHILGIQKFSSHTVRTIPSAFERMIIGEDEKRIAYYRIVMDKIKLRGYDIVHSHVDPWFTRLCQKSRTNKCGWVHTYHAYYFEADYPNGLVDWQKSLNENMSCVAPNAEVKISVSKWMHEFLLDEFSIETVVIPNGFDLDRCNRAQPERFTGRYGIKDFVLFVGSIYPIKNSQAFFNLAQRIPDMRFVMIARGFDTKKIAETYHVPIPPNLTIIGELEHEEVLDAMSACRVFVMTSRREGLPTVLLEAMALAKPVVASNVYGCNEVVCHEEDGLLFELNSIEDLVEKTKRAFEANQMGQKARDKVVATYAWEVVAKRIDAVYESLR